MEYTIVWSGSGEYLIGIERFYDTRRNGTNGISGKMD